MRIVFVLDDKRPYLVLLKAAARSLARLYPDITPDAVYAGDKDFILDGIREAGINLLRYRPRLTADRLPEDVVPKMGCLLKLELALVPELADEDYVLYCDTDVYFHQPFDDLLAMEPPYLAMARESTAPFYHDHEQLSYRHKDRDYTVKMPFPIWTYSSGVALFNLARLRRRDLVHHLLAFAEANLDKIGNLDQSLLNYFFGKRITKVPRLYNSPPYLPGARQEGRIIHFHGAKPWHYGAKAFKDMQINHYGHFCRLWLETLDAEDRAWLTTFRKGNKTITEPDLDRDLARNGL